VRGIAGPGVRPGSGGESVGVPVGGEWRLGGHRAAGGELRCGSLGKSVQSGVHHDHHGSESATSFDLNIYIFRNMHSGGGSWGERETSVAPPVMLEPLGHSPRLMFRFERKIPIKRNYFAALLTGVAEFLSSHRTVLVIQFNWYKGGARSVRRGQVHLLPAPKIKSIWFVPWGVHGGFSFAPPPQVLSAPKPRTIN